MSRPDTPPADAPRQSSGDWNEMWVAARSVMKALREGASLVPVQPRGSLPPLFHVTGKEGRVTAYQRYLPYLGDEQPLYVMQPFGMDGRGSYDPTIEAMAGRYLREVRDVQPKGPYHLSGYCAGGPVAFEMAQQLVQAGERIAFLGLLDAWDPSFQRWRFLARTLVFEVMDRRGWVLRVAGGTRWIARQVRARLLFPWRRVYRRTGRPLPRWLRYPNIAGAIQDAIDDYEPQPYPGSASLIRGADPRLRTGGGIGEDLGWRRVVQGSLDIHHVPGIHRDFVQEGPVVGLVAGKLAELLKAAQRREGVA